MSETATNIDKRNQLRGSGLRQGSYRCVGYVPPVRGVENTIVCSEKWPAGPSLDSAGVSTRNRSFSNRCCPVELSARGSGSSCSCDEVSLRGVTLPDILRI